MPDALLSDAAKMSQALSSSPALKPDHLDDLGRALLLLARELWVTKDRQIVLEAVLAERGIEVADAVRDYQPQAAVEALLKAERERFQQALGQALGAFSSDG